MNTTPFMDKQIMDLTHGSSTTQQHSKDFIDLMKHEPSQQHHHHLREGDDDEQEEKARDNGINRDEIVPSYDFQPIRPLTASSYDSAPNFSAAFSRPWNSDSNSKNYSSLDSVEPAKVIVEKDRSASDTSILSEIDRTMKKHMENMLNVLEGVSARLTQLETRTHHLENSVDDLKVSVGNNHGITDGKLRQLENILREVQSGVIIVKDKQDIIMQAQMQVAKLQVSKTDQKSEVQASAITDPVQQPAPVQSQPQLPAPANLPQSIPGVPPPNAPPQPPPQQGLPPPLQQGLPPPPPSQLPNQFSPNQIQAASQRDPYFPPPVQSQETPNQQYQLPLSQPLNAQPGAVVPHQQYQQTPHPQYSQPAPHLPQQQLPSHQTMNPSQLQSSQGHHVEEPPYPPQNYPPNVRQPPSQPPTGPPPQQFYGTPSHTYEPPSSRPGSGYSSGYGTLSVPPEQYRYGGPPQYGGNPALKPQQLPTSSVSPSGGGSYPQPPTARILPQALPTASAVSGSSGSAGTGGRVSVDDVVDKVASMGFPRDHVRATVRKLTENGQSVDLNAVLDKLMNDGDVPPPRAWFGR
ncbi:unnamed protein product [Sphenostylis stenocarpa]|uniref:DUF1421 domain-containing protein n=1 Tax=Sphenostylis stenocarpa TaxID=92480 RepID=A0AA86VLF0_9FABA|nr:unnamed protein product [Sphenostylis stenocarpa]